MSPITKSISSISKLPTTSAAPLTQEIELKKDYRKSSEEEELETALARFAVSQVCFCLYLLCPLATFCPPTIFVFLIYHVLTIADVVYSAHLYFHLYG